MRRLRRLHSLPALAAVAAIVVWSALSVVNALGTSTGGASASSGAYQYQYSGSITGSGTIASTTGQVSFSVSAKAGDTGTTGSCSVNEPATKTKIKCLGATSITFTTLANGCQLADVNGPATINGVPTTYEFQAVDCGSPGTGHDTFAIVADGYEREGLLTSGNLTVHG
jgi:hypothetical protein